MTTTQDQVVVERLMQLGVESRLLEVLDGPQVTTYVVEPVSERAKMFEYTRMKRDQDLAYALGVDGVKITAPMPNRKAVAIEVPKTERRRVMLADVGAPNADLTTYPLRVPVGVTTDNKPLYLPLASAPHVLCAGQTGGGKSTFLHALIAQLCRYYSPKQLELVLIDPKRVELTRWEDDPHMVQGIPVAETSQMAIDQLRGLVNVMERRYEALRSLGVQNLEEANRTLAMMPGSPCIPFVVCVIDEFAELMMASKKDAEDLAVRLAQKARAVGIHLVVATQYPLREVLTGLLRVNMPTKVAFSVTDKTASRLVLDRNGAEALLGKGDGLLSLGGSEPVRFQSAFADEDEIERVKEVWR